MAHGRWTCDARHTEEVGLRDAEDVSIWRYAWDEQAIILTKDEDVAARLRQALMAPVVVWLRIGNCSRRTLLKWFAPLLSAVLQQIEQGQRRIEVR